MRLFWLLWLLIFPTVTAGKAPANRQSDSITMQLLSFQAKSVVDSCIFPLSDDHWTKKINYHQGVWQAAYHRIHSPKGYEEITCRIKLTSGNVPSTILQLRFCFESWSKDNYVLLPGAVYNGNRFQVLDLNYPPLMSDPQYFRRDLPITITNLPRLNQDDQPSKIEQTTGDPSTPAMGFYAPHRQEYFWLLTRQTTCFGNSGLTVIESADHGTAEFIISAPAFREKRQTMAKQVAADDRAPDWSSGDEVELTVRVYQGRAERLSTLFERFVEIRQDLSGSAKLNNELPFSVAFDIIEKKYNKQNWEPSRGYYSVGLRESMNQDWQLGWVGGLQATLPLLAVGDSISRSRACQNLQTIITKSQAPSGFFYGMGDGVHWYGDGFFQPHPYNMHMVRKSSDALFFLCKQFLLLEQIKPNWQCPPAWSQSLQRLADAFVKLWQDNRQFGQYVDVQTGELLLHGTTAGAQAVAGLALASSYLHNSQYLQIAKQAAQYYYHNFIAQGITNGGPGEILQGPDSESAFAMLESFMTLYEVTAQQQYLSMAKEMATLCATWVVSYDYHFPDSSLFGKLGIKSSGAVIANVQNKHAGPGICTLSGNALLRLYGATGDTMYLNLLRDISHNITQYLSRTDRPVGELEPGWINERVNLSDWEGKANVGNIFKGTTWAEVSCLLTATEIPSLYIRSCDGFLRIFDHLDAALLAKTKSTLTLKLKNPTRYPATYQLLIENAREEQLLKNPLYYLKFSRVSLQPGQEKIITLDRDAKNVKKFIEPR